MAHYERDKDDHRVFDGGEDEDDGEGSQLPVVIIAAILVLAAFGGVVWLAYNQGVARGRGDATPRLAMSDTAKTGDSGLKVYQERAAGEDDDSSAKPTPAAAANQIAQAAPPPAAASTAPTPATTAPNSQQQAAATPPPATAATATTPAPVTQPPAAQVPAPQATKPAAPVKLAQAAPTPKETPPPAAKPPVKQAVASPVASAPQPVVATKPPTPLGLARPAAAAPIAPAPKADVAKAPPAPAVSKTATAVKTGSYLLQVGAYKSEEEATAAWKAYQAKHAALLSGFGPDIQRADVGDKVWYRLRIASFADKDTAVAVCDRLKAQNGNCFLAH